MVRVLAFLFLAMASLRVGQATTTTMMAGGTTMMAGGTTMMAGGTTMMADVAMTAIEGSMTVTGLDYSALTAAQKTDVIAAAKGVIATGAGGIDAMYITVTLAAGSTVVSYVIEMPTSMAAAANTALAAASTGSSATISSSLVTALGQVSSVTGTAAVTGSLSVTATAPTMMDLATTTAADMPSDKASPLGGVYAALAFAIMGSAAAHYL